MAYWMKDVIQDLEQFCEKNRLREIQKSLGEAEKVLDEEIRIREQTLLFGPVEGVENTPQELKLAKTGS